MIEGKIVSIAKKEETMSVPILLHEIFNEKNPEGTPHIFNWGKVINASSGRLFTSFNAGADILVDEGTMGNKLHHVRETLEEIEALVTRKLRETASAPTPP